MMCNDTVKKCINLELKLADIEKEFRMDLSSEQKSAIKLALKNKISIITGGPRNR